MFFKVREFHFFGECNLPVLGKIHGTVFMFAIVYGKVLFILPNKVFDHPLVSSSL